MIPESWRSGEVAVIGLGRSGTAAAEWLLGRGVKVYASDVADKPGVRRSVERLRAIGADAEWGRHDLERMARAAAVVVSPGVPPYAESVAAARAAGVEVISELELGARALAGSRLLVVTGTNGKSTTTALAAHLLNAGEIPAVAAGNIGLPLTRVATGTDRYQWVAAEASSFQLHDSPGLRPTIGVLTNLAPDHLDRYRNVNEYFEDKRRLFQNADAECYWVLNSDDEAALALARGVPGEHLTFSIRTRADAWYDRDAGTLMMGERPLLARDDFRPMGDHNVGNALAAALAAGAAGVPRDALAVGLARFNPLEHRLEPVREVSGVLWINDSKATNVASTKVALAAMDRPYVAILGGRSKTGVAGDHGGGGFEVLRTALSPLLREVIAYGEAAESIERDLGDTVPVRVVPQFDDAVASARESARRGEAVLLSPACASFDQFSDYEERGRRFRKLVEGF